MNNASIPTERMTQALRDLMRAYVVTLENARDRIIFLGGECDSLAKMVDGDPALRAARAALEQPPEPPESEANAKSRRETVEHCDKAGDFVTDVDGYVYFWPCRHGRGHMASHHLRWIADEMDRRNGPWDAEIAAYFDKQPETKRAEHE